MVPEWALLPLSLSWNLPGREADWQGCTDWQQRRDHGSQKAEPRVVPDIDQHDADGRKQQHKSSLDQQQSSNSGSHKAGWHIAPDNDQHDAAGEESEDLRGTLSEQLQARVVLL